MSIILTSREFNQDTARAKRAAEAGPVIITDRGRPAHVLMSIADYRRLTGAGSSLAAAIADPSGGDFDFVPPRLSGAVSRPADLD